MITINLQRSWKELYLFVTDYLDIYENHLEFLEAEVESEDPSWTNLFDIRARLLVFITEEKYAYTSLVLNKRRIYQKHCKKLRQLDRILIEKAPFIIENFDLPSFREYMIKDFKERFKEEWKLHSKEVKEQFFQTFWWFALDLIILGKYKFPTYIPSWILKPKTHNIDAVIIKGIAKGKKSYSVMLFLPSRNLPYIKRKRLIEELTDNFVFDVTSLLDTTSSSGAKETYLLFLTSGFIGKLNIQVPAPITRLKEEKLLIALPKKDSVFFNNFFEELEMAVKTKNTKFFNQKTLTKEQFIIKELDYISAAIESEIKETKIKSPTTIKAGIPTEVTLVSY